MSGPERAKVVAQAQDLNLGGKKAQDLIDPDVAVAWSGVNGKVTGTIKKVTDFTAFGKSQKEGHFFPLALNEAYKGKQITLKNRVDGDRTVTVDEDLMLVLRVENFADGHAVAAVDGETVFALDFSGATLGE